MTIPLEIPKGFPETILANKTVFPSRLSCENDYGTWESRNDFFERFRWLTHALVVLITWLPASISKVFSRFKIEPLGQEKDFLLLSHYVGGHHAYQKDPFLGLVAETLRSRFKTFTFFLNSTKEGAFQAEKSIRETLADEFRVNDFSWNISRLLQITFRISADSLFMIFSRRKSFKELKYSLCSNFLKSYKSQLSILLAWESFAFLIQMHSPRFILMPCEGNSHELLFLHRLKLFFPEIRVVMYQHAPIVIDQPGFYRVVANMRQTDILLLSSSHSEKLLRSTLQNQTIKCRVEVVGSSRAMSTNTLSIKREISRDDFTLNVLVALEGTECSVNELLGFLQFVHREEVPRYFRIRFHPDYLPSSKAKKILNSLEVDYLVSSNNLVDDLLWADEVWLRTSSVADYALRLHVLPVHFNINPKIDLNPLKDLHQPYLQVKSLTDLQNLPKMRFELGNLSFSGEDKDFLFQQFNSNVLRSLFD